MWVKILDFLRSLDFLFGFQKVEVKIFFFFFFVYSFLFFHSLVVEKVRIAYLVLEKGEVMKRNVIFFFIKES